MARFVAVLLLTLSLGLHWALLQTVAWTGMVVSYSRSASFAEAVSKTFDGKHPCCLCKLIQKGRANERKQGQPQAQPGSKLDLGLVWEGQIFDFTSDREWITRDTPVLASRSDQPPSPPPREFPSNIPA